MRYSLNFFCLILLLTSCNTRELDYSKIDFETRKIVKNWYDYEIIEIERTSEQEKKKYKFYESEIKNYKKRVLRNIEYSDSLRNYKSQILNKIERKHEAQNAEKNNSSQKQIDLLIEFSDPQEEYDFNKDLNKYDLEDNRRKLDSLQALYAQVNENDKYYKLKYLLKYKPENSDKKKSQELEVLVDENSEIFDYLFLDKPRDLE